MIVAHRLNKKFGTFAAVDSIELEVPRGEVAGFLGPNGAGKTTAIRMICGYLRPTSGTVELAGVDVVASPRAARKQLGYLPESAPLYGEMRVIEYLDFRARIAGVPRSRRRAAEDRAIQQCSLQEVRRRPIVHLSRGYRQRVGLAAALLHEPAVLVLDEPTSGLDPAQIVEVRSLIRSLAGGHTVLLSTHNLSEAEMVCDRIIMLARGRVRASGTLEELRRAAAGPYVVECNMPGAAAAIQSLGGVAEVRAIDLGGAWQRLEVLPRNGTGDLREAIAKAVTRGGALRELRREAPSLEHLFVRLLDEVEPLGREGKRTA